MHRIKHDTPSVQQEVVPVMASRQHGLRLQSLGESRQRVTPSRDGLETANASSSSGDVVIGARTAWDDSDDANDFHSFLLQRFRRKLPESQI